MDSLKRIRFIRKWFESLNESNFELKTIKRVAKKTFFSNLMRWRLWLVDFAKKKKIIKQKPIWFRYRLSSSILGIFLLSNQIKSRHFDIRFKLWFYTCCAIDWQSHKGQFVLVVWLNMIAKSTKNFVRKSKISIRCPNNIWIFMTLPDLMTVDECLRSIYMFCNIYIGFFGLFFCVLFGSHSKHCVHSFYLILFISLSTLRIMIFQLILLILDFVFANNKIILCITTIMWRYESNR